MIAALSAAAALFGVVEIGGGGVVDEGTASFASRGDISITESIVGALAGAFESVSPFPAFHRRCLFVGSCDLLSPSALSSHQNVKSDEGAGF